MKKILYILLVVAVTASCAKTNEVDSEGIEIKIAPITKLQTKAYYFGAVNANTYPTNENFDLYAYWKDVPAGEKFSDGQVYLQSIDETNSGVEFTNKGEYWGGVDIYFWPKVGSLCFAAYSPSHLNVAHSQTDDKYSIYGYTQPTKTDATFDFLVAPTTPSYSLKTETEKVAIDFKHALSWITFKVLGDNVTSNGKFVINSLTMNDVKIMADFTSDDMKWDVKNTIRQFPVFTGQRNLTTEAAVLENVSCGTLVVPQINNEENYKATIEFTNNLGDTVINEVVTVDLGKGWEIGKHYTYYITFTAKEILIEPHMEDWIEVDAADQFIF